MTLPIDLHSAELYSYTSLDQALNSKTKGYWEVNLDIPGLKSMPVAIRLFQWLRKHIKSNLESSLLFPDAGNSALAQREAPELSKEIVSFKDYFNRQQNQSADSIIVTVAPEQADYKLFEEICNKHSGHIILFNGKLEDLAVGIGSVARERRRGFLSIWQQAYVLKSLKGGALQRRFPHDWEIYKRDVDGYRFLVSTPQKPDSEMLVRALRNDQIDSLGMKFQALDRYIQSLTM
ncbi:All3116 protein (chromatophore) [Paulinella micropora]|uniref:All3116 protein n=1 Tax=Paulinella micropora TaxID=1928728 RepID=A0A1L5YB67_9EUKA|nr:hypothetical protein PCKR_148 [Paulinella micropora]AQX44713.1 hypothetical protein PFK_148 [Paulinella micropora]BBL85923.1 All3116 protein [Paulinella micropora]